MKAVNLIPSDERSGAGNLAGSSEGGAFIVLGLMAGLAVLALMYGIAHHQISSSDGQAAKLQAQAAQAQAQANQLAPYTNFIALRQQREQAVSQLVEARFDWAHALHELGRVLPFDVALTSVHGSIAALETAALPAAVPSVTSSSSTSTTSTSSSTAASSTTAPSSSSTSTTTSTSATPGSTAGTPVASATPAGSTPTFTIVGCATTQSEVARTLNRLRLIDGVTEVTLQSSTKGDSSSSGSSGSCPATDPTFTAVITYDALPAASAGSSAGTAAGSATASSTAASTTPGTPTATNVAATNGGS